jgi:hypothetical protein
MIERFRERVADSLATDPADRRGQAHVAVLGVRELRTETLAAGERRSVRVVGSDRNWELLAVPAVERELEAVFRSLIDVEGTAGVQTTQLRHTGEAVFSVRQCPSITRGNGAVGDGRDGPIGIQPGSVFPFVTELRQPTFAEVLYLLAYVANRDNYRGVYDAGQGRATRLGPDFDNHVAMVVTNWKTASPSGRDLSRAVATALASGRTHGEFATGADGRYDFAEADLAAVMTADRPHGVEATLDALVHAIEDVIPFGATHGLNSVIGPDVVGPVVEAVTERPRTVTDVVS